ncbi:MAG TPA: chorismate mutase [Thermococcaceae archaeon]|uniref:Chorismate mutase n=1 Tax=Thermococcus sibiricus TaxID=172049 RepID=A0A101EM60_9EURY|nr:chorismate mutase [Thermococcus sibiricus]KUK17941.1 MAG: Chorismate mutase [Thermococcus sibiricus]KUK29318.1 MAG: Chorismate mutase [Thermococcus sp. 40_45]MBC7094622.1 chorismate mutase [Thermococcus sp.]HII67900.1 chorismate mutase [Thermococcaceae archaeon]
MERLHKLRKRIDEIDEQITELLEERARIAKEIGEIKKELNLPIRDEKREKEVLKRAGKFKKVFEEIMEVCRNVQGL